MKKSNAARYSAIVKLYHDSGIGAYRNAMDRLVAEIGDDAVQRLAEDYEETRIAIAEAHEEYRNSM